MDVLKTYTREGIKIISFTFRVDVTYFGAKGDGTDATDAFNRAIAACPAGGTVFVPAGIYLINSTLRLSKINVTLKGEGKGSLLLRAPGFNGVLVLGNALDITIDSLTIDGNVSGNTVNQFAEVQFSKDRGTVQNCALVNTRAQNVAVAANGCKVINSHLVGSNSAFIPTMGVWLSDSPFPKDILVHGNIIENHGINGLFGAGYNIIIDTNVFRNNHLQTNPTGGGQLNPVYKNLTDGSMIISNNTIIDGGNTSTCGIECNQNNTIITNNFIAGNKNGGIYVQQGQSGKNITISNNIIMDNGNTTYGDGITIGGDIYNIIVTDNKIYSPKGTQVWGINVQSGSGDGHIICHNDLRGNVNSSGITFGSTSSNNIVKDNLPIA